MPHEETPWLAHLKEPWALAPILGAAPWVILAIGWPILSALSRTGDEVALAQGGAVAFALCSLPGGLLAVYFGRKAKKGSRDRLHRAFAQVGWILGILDVTLLLFCSLRMPGDARASRRDKEERVRAVAYQVDQAIREFQQDHAGMKPNALTILEAVLPDTVKVTPNPFVPRQSYNLYTGGLVDRAPRGPGQIGYLFQGQRLPYKVIANGWQGPVLILEEKPLSR
jgi:hypothetical protein